MIRFVFLALLPLCAPAQDVAVLLNRAAQAEAAFREPAALSDYQQVVRLQPHQVLALCRCADLSCRIGNRFADRDKKIDYFKTGYHYAQMAYGFDSTNSEANVVMAFALGRLTLIQTNKERVEAAVAIKHYTEKAIRYDPSNYKAWHILGRWQYEVSRLSWVERTFARWFFGALPEASLPEAIRCYEKSMALRPDFMLNYLELARCWHRDGQDGKAIPLLRKMLALGDTMYDDREVRQEGAKMLHDFSSP
jgi:tetratricopeptide (TPR) repeat protein